MKKEIGLLILFFYLLTANAQHEFYGSCYRLNFKTKITDTLSYVNQNSRTTSALFSRYAIINNKPNRDTIYKVELTYFHNYLKDSILIRLSDNQSKVLLKKIKSEDSLPILIKDYQLYDTTINLTERYSILLTIDEPESIILNQFTTIDSAYHFHLIDLRNSYRKAHLKNSRIFWQRITDSLRKVQRITDIADEMRFYKDSKATNMYASGELIEKIKKKIDSVFVTALRKKIDSVFLSTPLTTSKGNLEKMFNQNYNATYTLYFSNDGHLSSYTKISSSGSDHFLPNIKNELNNFTFPVATQSYSYDVSEFEKFFKNKIELTNSKDLLDLFFRIKDTLSSYKDMTVNMYTVYEGYKLNFRSKLSFMTWREKETYFEDIQTGKPVSKDLEAILRSKDFYNSVRKKYSLMMIQGYFNEDNLLLQDVRLSSANE